ncbi:MAG TPA: class I adenylate-forming enzyme family protein, partial [Acidimicrobiales bacterium]
MTPEAETIPALLALRAKADPGVQAIVADGASATYAELDSASAALAARLVAAGVVKGDRVGLQARNSVEWAVIAYAALRIGAVLVPLSTLLRPPELHAQLATAAVSHLVGSDLDRAGLPSLRAVWPIGGIPEAAAPEALVQAMEARVRPADDLTILFTSGSTGTPKGVIHTHGGAIRATAAGLDLRGVGAGERLY